MKKKALYPPAGPAPVGAYSPAVAVGPWLFLSGQIPVVPETGEIIRGDIRLATQRVLQNVQAVLQAGDMSFAHVVKAGVFLKNIADFSSVNEVYSRFFTKPFPARSLVAVQELPKSVDIEMEIIAYRETALA